MRRVPLRAAQQAEQQERPLAEQNHPLGPLLAQKPAEQLALETQLPLARQSPPSSRPAAPPWPAFPGLGEGHSPPPCVSVPLAQRGCPEAWLYLPRLWLQGFLPAGASPPGVQLRALGSWPWSVLERALVRCSEPSAKAGLPWATEELQKYYGRVRRRRSGRCQQAGESLPWELLPS